MAKSHVYLKDSFTGGWITMIKSISGCQPVCEGGMGSGARVQQHQTYFSEDPSIPSKPATCCIVILLCSAVNCNAAIAITFFLNVCTAKLVAICLKSYSRM